MRKLLVGVLAGAVFAWTVPAVAQSEPTAPIVDLRLDVYKYPDETVRIPCSKQGAPSGVTIDWGFVRIEPRVTVADRPSEHWTTKVRVWGGPYGAAPEWPNPRTGSPENRLNSEWDAEWRHQNVGPADPQNPWEVAQINHYFRGFKGTVAIEVIVKGDESGNRFVRRCVFERAK